MAAICEHCTQGYELPGEPKGIMKDSAYFVSGAREGESKKAIVILTDVFGLPLKNCKIMADHFADELGYDVWVPDMFDGYPIVEVKDLEPYLHDTPGQKLSFIQKLGVVFTLLKLLPRFISNRDSVIDARVQTFIKKVKTDKKYEKIGAVGYCFGGAALIRLGGTDLIDSAVVAHPGRCNANQIREMKVPTAWLCAEEDMSFGPKLRNEAEAIFAARKDKADYIDYAFHDYKGTVHGFCARPNLGIPVVKEAWQQSFDVTVQWFKKTI